MVWMVTAGKVRRARIALLVLVAIAAFLHLIAWQLAAPYADASFPPDRETLIALTGSALLACTVMISQAMESVTRAFYARGDLDLLMSSPAPTRSIFMLRTAATGLSASGLALALIGPFINMLALAGGPHWLAAYGVLLALAAAATALAVGLTVLLFRTLGPRRTRFVAQVVAAIVGATFVIGIQVVSIFAYGNLSRFDAFHSEVIMHVAPEANSLFWLPARAAMGDIAALAVVLSAGFLLFCLAVSVASRRFGEFATAAASVGMGSVRQKGGRSFRRLSAAAALRRKEWTLLTRDPWLISQTLMQILYLIPPALLLWRNYGSAGGALVVLVPVLVMAAGQLAGGLAWLAISGEDAPELVTTAPVRAGAIMRAKVEAVIGAIAFVLGPIILALATVSPWTAFVAATGALCAAASATAIQMFFRAQAKRSNFRRRQTSSRIATFAEAFSSVGWAAAAGFAAAGNQLAIPTAAATLLILLFAGMFRPRQALA
jgi:ABC-2 type transport system permease protein